MVRYHSYDKNQLPEKIWPKYYFMKTALIK